MQRFLFGRVLKIGGWSGIAIAWQSLGQFMAQRDVADDVAQENGKQVPLFHSIRLHFVMPVFKKTMRIVYLHILPITKLSHRTYCRISDQSGCSPSRPGRAAWIRHGSSRMHALGPSSERICFSATDMSTADLDKSNGFDGSALRLRDRYVSVK